MHTPEEYRKYAEECERIARSVSPENRRILLNIARAWRERADHARRKSKTRLRLLMVIEPSDEPDDCRNPDRETNYENKIAIGCCCSTIRDDGRGIRSK